ncbi:MAG: 2-oxo acid dehydrogenase subunit E2 [Candidatus Omnitrophica bacterium]|nr:2-oxo acid dehydrogenase subunit E2 [Candidatus Omnitrophota bacterium]
MVIRLPKLGETADSGTVVNVFVKEGDTIQAGQDILELENEKAVAPIPSPVAGTISKVHVKMGDVVKTGQTLLTLEGKDGEVDSTQGSSPGEARRYTGGGRLKGTERAAGGRPRHEHIDFEKWGPVERKPLSGIRKTIGRRMTESWLTIPHVTQFGEADITRLNELISHYGPEFEKKGTRLTLTALMLKVVAQVLQAHPLLNSSLDEERDEVVTKKYFHIGIAVDTANGLIVPVIRNVDTKKLSDIARELKDLAERTRLRKVAPEELKGGTFTISNLGGIGGGHFAPVINYPEVAVLGVARGVLKPAVVKGQIVPRTILPLSVSYDHRLIDGADGARFMVELVRLLENPEEAWIL